MAGSKVVSLAYGLTLFAGCLSHTSAAAAAAVLEKRLPSLTQYDYKGCYADPSVQGVPNVLPSLQATGALMTLEKCAETCRYNIYFGVRDGSECWCGNALRTAPASVLEVELDACSTPCSGNALQECGASTSLSLYEKKEDAVIPPPTDLLFKSIGCYSYDYNAAGGGTLTGNLGTFNLGLITHERCEDVCRGSKFFSVTANICRCGDALTSTTMLKNPSTCDFLCTGNSGQRCGGFSGDKTNVFGNYAACSTLNTPRRVQNPGFENGEIAWAPSRTGAGTIKWSVRKDVNFAYTGSRFSRFDLLVGATGDFALSQRIAVCPGTAYVLEVAGRKSNVEALCFVQAYFQGQQVITFLVGSGAWIPGTAFVRPSTDFPLLDLRIGCEASANGYVRQVFVDNVVLRPATPQEVADNGSQ